MLVGLFLSKSGHLFTPTQYITTIHNKLQIEIIWPTQIQT